MTGLVVVRVPIDVMLAICTVPFSVSDAKLPADPMTALVEVMEPVTLKDATLTL